MVRDENLRFMRNRDVYNSDYFNFTLSLASVNAVRAATDGPTPTPIVPCLCHPSLYTYLVQQTKLKHPDYQPMAKESLQLAVHFLLHTYLHTKKKLRYAINTHAASIPGLAGGAESHPARAAVSSLPAWTRRSGWPPWRCCCPRVERRVSGWCSTWWDRRAERSQGLCSIHQSVSQTIGGDFKSIMYINILKSGCAT